MIGVNDLLASRKNFVAERRLKSETGLRLSAISLRTPARARSEVDRLIERYERLEADVRAKRAMLDYVPEERKPALLEEIRAILESMKQIISQIDALY